MRTVASRDLTKSFKKPSSFSQSLTVHQSVASNVDSQLLPAASNVDSQLLPAASNIDSQLLPVASNVDSQLLPVASNVDSQLLPDIDSQLLPAAENYITANVSRTMLTLEHFLESSDETKLQNDLKSKTFMYMFQKYLLHKHCNGNTILRDMRYYFNYIFPLKLQASKVRYMELVNENPDSDKTISLVAEDILDKFGNNVQDRWVVLVGDCKTYQHLMNVKQTYGEAF